MRIMFYPMMRLAIVILSFECSILTILIRREIVHSRGLKLRTGITMDLQIKFDSNYYIYYSPCIIISIPFNTL